MKSTTWIEMVTGRFAYESFRLRVVSLMSLSLMSYVVPLRSKTRTGSACICFVLSAMIQKSAITHVYASFFQPLIRRKHLGNWPNMRTGRWRNDHKTSNLGGGGTPHMKNMKGGPRRPRGPSKSTNYNLQTWPCTWPFEAAEEKVYFLRGLLECLQRQKMFKR